MTAEISYFGIRHHGPGSARRLVEALETLAPRAVLIEGPTDLTALMPALGHASMVPPVALLAYSADAPEQAAFWPFAEFSPEYQAARWALANGAELRLIDLPVAMRINDLERPTEEEPETVEGTEDDGAEAEVPEPSVSDDILRDPIGALAHAAGYEDGESWWNDVIEENPSPDRVFAAVEEAMTALREHTELTDYEAAREAQMRLEIASAAKEIDGPIAVVCGAWHVPALKQKFALKDDRALLKGRPKTKIKATWAPWTEPRLARASGYGAGVPAPGWYKHLWQKGGGEDGQAAWVGRIAGALRDEGQSVSTASMIETVRLTRSLAALRDRPAPGFEELRDASVACLCYGEELPWHQIENALLLGNEVGRIPDDTPLAPLLEDLQRQQKKTRLKPEALERELSLDLRADAGLARSTLLHRLNALDVPWGRLTDAGRSRGTFRERWVLAWEPEYAVRLVEHLVYGPTIQQAAAARSIERIRAETGLASLAELVQGALTAQLDEAADTGIDRLGDQAAHTDDCGELLAALPPLVDAERYGTARQMSRNRLGDLMRRIALQASISLPYATRNLDRDAAVILRDRLLAAHQAVALAEMGADETGSWYQALEQILADNQATRMIAGLAARLVYEAERIDADGVVTLMNRMLSAATPAPEAAGFFEGFFDGAGQRLLYDEGLRDAVDVWLLSLDEDTFTEYLPLFRRVFSALDPTERRNLIERLFKPGSSADTNWRLAPDAEKLWAAHLEKLTGILIAGRNND